MKTNKDDGDVLILVTIIFILSYILILSAYKSLTTPIVLGFIFSISIITFIIVLMIYYYRYFLK